MVQQQGPANPLMLVTMRFDGEQEFVLQSHRFYRVLPTIWRGIIRWLGVCTLLPLPTVMPAAFWATFPRCHHPGVWPATAFWQGRGGQTTYTALEAATENVPGCV